MGTRVTFDANSAFGLIFEPMLWILISLFFVWCAYREIRSSLIAPAGFDSPRPLSKPYLAVVLTLAVLFAWPPIHKWHFERFLSEKATELADNHRAKVHCNTVWDTMLDTEMFSAGHAEPDTGQIGLQHPWCSTLRSYLNTRAGRARKNFGPWRCSHTRACTSAESSTKPEPNVRRSSGIIALRSSSGFRIQSPEETLSTTTTSSTRSAGRRASCKPNTIQTNARPVEPWTSI